MRNKGPVVVRAILAVLTLLLVGYGGMLVRAKLELGASPDAQVLGTTGDISQRAMEQYCTGVLATPEGTWLVGRREGKVADFEFAKGAPDLSELVYSKSDAEQLAGDEQAFSSYLGSSSESYVSFISRLNQAGVFELVAVVPEAACLSATPDGKHLYLLTGLAQPDSNTLIGSSRQLVILQSDDQGQSWQWRKAGLFPDNGLIAWSLKPYFYDANSVWAWRDTLNLPADSPGQFHSSLQFSPDGGASIEEVTGAAPLLLDIEEAYQYAKGLRQLADSNDRFGEEKRHVVQFSPEQAALWVSQSFHYASNGSSRSTYLKITSYAPLQRQNGQWRMGPIQRQAGISIEELLDNRSGQLVAIIHDENQPTLRVALLDKTGLSWQDQGPLPGAFGLMTTWSAPRQVLIGSQVLVVNSMSEHQVPRWIYPWDKEGASISADAVYYSTDWGRSWSSLAIDGYLGLQGLDSASNRVFWAKGNWYDSQDRQVHSYGLY